MSVTASLLFVNSSASSAILVRTLSVLSSATMSHCLDAALPESCIAWIALLQLW